MTQNILINGAAGYVGGSVLAHINAIKTGPIKDARITAAVKSPEQVEAISKLGVNVIQLELTDDEAVRKAILDNKIDVIIHTATGWTPSIVSSLLKGLGERRKVSEGEKIYIHTSVTTPFSVMAGWPNDRVSDDEPLYDMERKYEGGHPVRVVNGLVADLSKELGIKSVNIALPVIYGTGLGEWRKLSVNIPATIRAALKDRVVRRFDVEGTGPAAHVEDVADIYGILLEKLLLKEDIPTNANGIYFATAHPNPRWAVADGLAKALYKRGLVDTPEVKEWPSHDAAADALGYPRPFASAMECSGGEFVAAKAAKVGWQPKWTLERYLNSMDDEVQSVLDLDTVKPTIFDSLIKGTNY